MKVQCPNCKWSADVPDEKIPVDGATGTCPKCKTKFTFVRSVSTPSRLSNVDTKIATETSNDITCPKCKHQYDASQFKVCPACSKRVGYGCLVIIIIIFVFIFRSCGSSSKSTTPPAPAEKPTQSVPLKNADEIAQEHGIPVEVATKILTRVKTDFPPVSQSVHLKQQVDAYKEKQNAAYKELQVYVASAKADKVLTGIVSQARASSPNDYDTQLTIIKTALKKIEDNKPPPPPPPPDLEVLKSSFVDKEISGYIKNNTSNRMGYVCIKFNLYNANGIQIGSTLDNTNNLEPGGIWKFKAHFTEDDVTSVKITEIKHY